MKKVVISIPEFEKKLEEIKTYLEQLLQNEKSYDHVLSSMCTPPTELTRFIAGEYAEINLGDPGLFPKAVELENEVLEEIAQMLNAPKTWVGSTTSGGSESNLIGCWAARNWSKKKKGITNGKILLPKSAHISFEKTSDILDLEIDWIPLTKNNQIDIEIVKERLDAKTVALVGIAGTTGTGVCDDIQALSEIAVDKKIPLHVDAAHGGMILPFLNDIDMITPSFSFENEGVTSITIDNHKILGSLIPGGNIIFRSEKYTENIVKRISYLSDSQTRQITITGTRPGNSVIAAWVLLKKFGKEFMVSRVKNSLELTKYLVEQLKEIPNLELAFEPTLNIIGFSTRKMATEKLVEELKKSRWDLSIYSFWVRIVVMPHYTKEMVDKFIKVLKEILN
ncbi:MAG: tyrosine decarboxylase MfnA [Candidatus Heimdallarchaeota archaeon]